MPLLAYLVNRTFRPDQHVNCPCLPTVGIALALAALPWPWPRQPCLGLRSFALPCLVLVLVLGMPCLALPWP
jgi:hypothetical protein